MPKPLVVGVDVGTTSAIAIFDLKRNLLYSESKRDFSYSDMISRITKFGMPLIIATDKQKIPMTIRKLAAQFNCKIFNPDHDLDVEEKNNIVNVSIKDEHEKDAIASAMFAYKSYAAQFTNIDKNLPSDMKEYSDKIKEMILNKEAKNISEAIVLLKAPLERREDIMIKEKMDWKEKAFLYKKKVEELQKRYDIIKIYSDKLEERIRDLDETKKELIREEMKKNEKVRREIMGDKEIRNRDLLIRQLQYELTKVKGTIQPVEKPKEEKKMDKKNFLEWLERYRER